MNRRVFFSIILAALFCMTGCRLAKDESAQMDDALVGVLVTTEYLDLFDFESYFMDNAGKLASGSSIGPEESAKYSGAVWAEQQTRGLTGEGADDDADVVEHVFPGIDGGSWSQTMEETATTTENGKSLRRRTKVTINIRGISAPADIAVIEMDPNSSVISRAKYAAGEVPDIIGTAAEYIIVETRDSIGSVNRELFGRDCTSFSTFYCREDGICIATDTEIAWQE